MIFVLPLTLRATLDLDVTLLHHHASNAITLRRLNRRAGEGQRVLQAIP